ncbi:MAG: tetratricopeptide repeat protein [Gammaproteobacteria bacterium]|nr:tetratricopeptide repeat protein [Gammaproteobacteria bacterium]
MSCPDNFTTRSTQQLPISRAGFLRASVSFFMRRAGVRTGAAVALVMATTLPWPQTEIPGTGVSVSFTSVAVAQQIEMSALDALNRGNELLLRGSYLAAVEAFTGVRDDTWREQAVLGISKAHMLTGQYEQAMAAVRPLIRNPADSPVLATQMAELYRMTGLSEEAEAMLEQIVEGQLTPPVRTLVQYGLVLELRGKTTEATAQFNAALARYDSGLVFDSADVGMVALAAWKLDEFHDANALFSEAVRLDGNNLEALTLWGDLFQEKFNDADAEANYMQVLDINRRYAPALVGMARIGSAERYLAMSLEANARNVAALETYGLLMIRNYQEEAGRGYLEQALRINPESIPALASLAALAAINEDTQAFDQIVQQVNAFSPDSADFYASVADYLGNNYRFTEAVAYARRAIASDPEHWHAHTVLGGNLVRLGEEVEGKQHLEQAFDNDPFNVMTSNMLQVFDVLEGYATLESEHFRVNMSHRDAQILWPYMEPLLEESWDRLVEKYQFEPDVPVVIQVFERSEDFAVRSVGLPDIGPLVGICFGKVVTLISPDTLSANWQEIVWHELVHVFTLQMTQNKMPRWLSEGISTWEERQARPEWGRRLGLELVRAVQQDRMLPVSDLNKGFTGANSNADLSFAYFQSYLVVEYIAEQYGFEKLRELILEYNVVRPESEMFANVFGMDMQTFDAGFRQWIVQRVEDINVYVHVEDGPDEGAGHGHGVRENNSAVLAELYNNQSLKEHMEGRVQREPRDFQAHLQLGIVLFREQNYEQAIIHLQTAKAILPDYTGYPSPSLVLSQIFEAQGDTQAMMQELAVMLENQQHDFESALKLANAAMDAGDLEQADYYIDRALSVNPYRPEIHQSSALLAQRQGDTARAVQEFEVLVTLDQRDPVDTQTNLAGAYLDNNQAVEARRTVLRALETAPGYERAQEILLRAVEQSPSESGAQ